MDIDILFAWVLFFFFLFFLLKGYSVEVFILILIYLYGAWDRVPGLRVLYCLGAGPWTLDTVLPGS
jgi:hypothetical protein